MLCIGCSFFDFFRVIDSFGLSPRDDVLNRLLVYSSTLDIGRLFDLLTLDCWVYFVAPSEKQ